QTGVEQQVKKLTETMQEETKLKQGAEQQAGEIGQRRSELETQLGQLRQELENAHKQAQTQQGISLAEQARLEARIQELQSAQAGVEQQVKKLTETLQEETKLRQGAEQQVGEIGQRRSELEAQLGQLRQELESAHEQAHGQQTISLAEQTRLEARIQELQSAHSGVEQQVKKLTETLQEETKLRQGAEQQAGEIGKQRSELQAEIK